MAKNFWLGILLPRTFEICRHFGDRAENGLIFQKKYCILTYKLHLPLDLVDLKFAAASLSVHEQNNAISLTKAPISKSFCEK